MSHANAPLTPAGRLLMVRRVEAGVPQAHVARQMRLSRGTVAKWWNRYVAEGEAGLVDRSSRPRRCPARTRRGSRSGSAGWGAARAAGRCISGRAPGRRRRRCGGSFSATG